MKKFLTLLAFAAIAAFACSEAAAEDTLKDFTIEVNFVYPSSFPSYPSSDGYTLSVRDSVASADLPFVGKSDTPVFSSDEIGYNFKDCPIELKIKKKKDRTIYKFKAKSGFETIDVTVELWPDGAADITCYSPSKSIMRYRGELREASPEE